MKALIFGVNGQDGFFLRQLLERQGHEVIGISRHHGLENNRIDDYAVLSELIRSTRPEYIFHLAANSTTQHSALFENHITISGGTLAILESVKNFSPETKVFISGSGLQFRNQELPIKESDPFEARDPYSVSRIQSVYAARYFRRLGVKAYVGYFFNHESSLRGERHMTKKIAEAAKRIAAGSVEKLEIGDISTVKEYTYAGDIVEAVWTLMQQDVIMEANLGSGLGYSIEDWLSACFKLINRDWRDYVILKKDFVADYKKLISEPKLIYSLGWKPSVSFEGLAKMMMA